MAVWQRLNEPRESPEFQPEFVKESRRFCVIWLRGDDTINYHKDSTMAKIISDGLDLVIYEDDNYDLHLARKEDAEQHNGKFFGLYLVSLTYKLNPERNSITSNHYVIAESEEGAIGQATCGLPGGLDHSWKKCVEDGTLKANASRIPVQIRGWSSKTF